MDQDPALPMDKIDDGQDVPFFSAPDAGGGPASSRFLLISYHFPPAGSVGALRWQKLLQFAAQRGWRFDVIAAHPSSMEAVDASRLAELPPGTRVYGVPLRKRLLERMEAFAWRAYARLRGARREKVLAVEASATQGSVGQAAAAVPSAPTGLKARLRAARRAYFAWMDYHTHAGWVRDAVRVGERLLPSGGYRAIITSGPPHMAHEAGRRLSARFGVPLVVDLRDAWSLVQRLADVFDSPLWYALARRYEAPVMAQASLIVMNTARARAAMQEAYPALRDRIVAVMNGFDDEKIPPVPEKNRFVVAYAGAMYLDRDPTQLLDVVARVVRDLRVSPDQFGLEFMGHVESYQGISLQQFAQQAGIGDYVSVAGPGPRDAALSFMSRAAVLVSLPLFRGRLTPQDGGRPLQGASDMAIPAKLFEYIQFDAWLLIVAQRGSAAETLFRESGADVAEPGDSDRMVEVLKSRYLQFRNGERPRKLALGMPFASRRAQAALLFDAIEGLGRT